MKFAILAVLSAAIGLQGCQSVLGFNEALVPQLKPIEARIATVKTCGDMVRDATGVVGEQPGAQLNADQALRLVQACEQRDKDGSVTIDPQGARKALRGALQPSAVVGAVAP
jgi:hypothetical protein